MSPTDSKVLVVDDEPTVRTTLEMAFSTEGLEVVTTDSAEAAAELMAKETFGVLITDKNLPGITGVDLIRLLRNRGDQTPAFLVTGHASVRSALDTMNLGVEGYLEKPFDDIFALVKRVKAVMTRPALKPGQSLDRASRHFGAVSEVLASASAAVGGGPQILIANANAGECEWLQSRLGIDGADVTTVDSGEAALVGRVAATPDLMFIDAPPDETALEDLMTRVQSRFPRAVKVVTANQPSLGVVIKLIDLGVRAVVEKPLEDDSFHDKVDGLLEPWRGGRPSDGGRPA